MSTRISSINKYCEIVVLQNHAKDCLHSDQNVIFRLTLSRIQGIALQLSHLCQATNKQDELTLKSPLHMSG